MNVTNGQLRALPAAVESGPEAVAEPGPGIQVAGHLSPTVSSAMVAADDGMQWHGVPQSLAADPESKSPRAELGRRQGFRIDQQAAQGGGGVVRAVKEYFIPKPDEIAPPLKDQKLNISPLKDHKHGQGGLRGAGSTQPWPDKDRPSIEEALERALNPRDEWNPLFTAFCAKALCPENAAFLQVMRRCPEHPGIPSADVVKEALTVFKQGLNLTGRQSQDIEAAEAADPAIENPGSFGPSLKAAETEIREMVLKDVFKRFTETPVASGGLGLRAVGGRPV